MEGEVLTQNNLFKLFIGVNVLYYFGAGVLVGGAIENFKKFQKVLIPKNRLVYLCEHLHRLEVENRHTGSHHHDVSDRALHSVRGFQQCHQRGYSALIS